MISFYNEINKGLISGNFPVSKLYPVDDYSPCPYDIQELAANGLRVFEQYPLLLYALFKAFEKELKAVESLKRPQIFEKDVNARINIVYDIAVDALPQDIIVEASKLCPAVTSIEKIIWMAIASLFYADNNCMPNGMHFNKCSDMQFAFMYLLELARQKELLYGITVNTNSITPNTNILKLVQADWSKLNKNYFLKLTDYGVKRLKEVKDSARRLNERLAEHYNLQKTIAEGTVNEWHDFIKYINDISKKERMVIKQINSSLSAREKINIISGYNSIVKDNTSISYNLNGELVNLPYTFYVVDQRIKNAPDYCIVKTDVGKSFKLHPAALMLALEPKTYNGLFISFHEFRLKPAEITAHNFISKALTVINNNLGQEKSESTELIDMIRDFHWTVMGFVKHYWNEIDKLSYDSIRDNHAVVSPELAFLVDEDGWAADLNRRIKEIELSDHYDDRIYEFFTGKGNILPVNELVEKLEFEEQRCELIEKQNLASRIVTSLNIVYMFVEVLRIMITTHYVDIEEKDRDALVQYRRDLTDLDDKLIHKVYANLGEREIGMLEYREKNGINAITLTEQEKEVEKYRNSLFGDVLKEKVISLVEGLERQNTEQILEIKASIREEIFRFPDCDDKYFYAEWLDEICQRINEILINNCKKEKGFQEIKESMLSQLGERARMLPETAINTLTTAEMLYLRYAIDEYSVEEFDYSSISSLYFQAFEESYNELVWRGYADKLNALEINGQRYTRILHQYMDEEISIQEAKGYLDDSPNNRGYYVDYHKKNARKTKVKTHCMYGSFAKLLQKVNPSSDLVHLCDYMAMASGFADRNQMFNDADFMRTYASFSSIVERAKDDRNNASHGGTIISKVQCRIDRRTVLGELEMADENSVGLIQRLVYLLKFI